MAAAGGMIALVELSVTRAKKLAATISRPATARACAARTRSASWYALAIQMVATTYVHRGSLDMSFITSINLLDWPAIHAVAGG